MGCELKMGDYCRTKQGAPARYLFDGWCIWISTQDNSEVVSHGAKPPTGNEGTFPQVTDTEVRCAAVGLKAGILATRRDNQKTND